MKIKVSNQKRTIRFETNRTRYKLMAFTSIFSLLFQMIYPTISFGQSSGSGQTETMGGSGMSEMVDPFTGDFTYSIPLMNVEGFPLTLTYNGNTTMNQEASWVGLGFSLNPGAINRDMRGLPDDFNGNEDKVTKKLHTKNQNTAGTNIGAGYSVSFPQPQTQGSGVSGNFGIEAKLGTFNDTYSGFGINADFNFSLGGSATITNGLLGISPSMGINGGLNLNSKSGIGLNKSGYAGLELLAGENSSLGLGINGSKGTFNSTRGNKGRFIGGGVSARASNTQEDKRGVAGSYSMGGSSYITMGNKTYTPYMTSNYKTSSDFIGLKGGLVGQFEYKYGLIEDFSTDGFITNENMTSAAYGYLNLENATASNALMDFNRENESTVTSKIEVLPVTNLTYDIFRETGSSGSATFRAFRNDIGTVGNNANVLQGDNKSDMVEGAGPLDGTIYGKASYGRGRGYTDGKSGKWNDASSNKAKQNLSYLNVSSECPDCETYYFKNVGELTPYNQSFFDQYAGDFPINANLSVSGTDFHSQTTYGTLGANGLPLPTTNYQTGKQKRNTLYSQLNAYETEQIGFQTSISNYGLNDANNPESNVGYTYIDRTSAVRKDNHLSEFTVIKPGGARYVYNVPTYTILEKQVTFNASNNTTINHCDNSISYTAGVDNSMNNADGRNNLYHSTEVSSYAHSFLIGAILSDDYNDKTGNGLSEDDFGSYLKFNYTRLYGETDPFKWRTPYSDYSSPTASYFQGNLTYDDDRLGNYVYGEKELWYVQSIEGKNYIAKFYLSERDDMWSAVDEQGGLQAGKQGMKLDKIVLYNKEDLTNADGKIEPIQTVHFEYDYSLCKNYPGNNSTGNDNGKLTLKRLYTTYGTSKKERLNAYQFNYDGANYDYQGNKVDRWGIYKNAHCTINNNVDFPFAEQNKASRDQAVAAWSLTEVLMPSGGKFNVTYESDDYAYVENREAMIMVPIKSFGFSDEITNYPNLTGPEFREGKKEPRDIIYFNLPQAVNSATEFKEKYLTNLYGVESHDNKIYYQLKVETREGNGEYETLKGFVEVIDESEQDAYGIVGTLPSTTGYIRIGKVQVDDEQGGYEVNPIMHYGWQHLRQNVTRAIFPDGVGNAIGIDINTVFNGLNKALNKKKFCWQIDPAESFVRLDEPTKYKLGGGNRVKQITYTDNWQTMTGENNFTYGQTYTYNTAIDPSERNPILMSSGVAAYEPMVGNEVNPLRNPVDYTVENEKFPDDTYYQTEPFGESYYPSPIIGYSKVEVKNLERTNVTKNATGNTVYEFLTAKDYPTETIKTVLWDDEINPEKTWKDLVKGKMDYEKFGASQGFTIVKNDMHGKIYKITSNNESGVLVSASEYTYRDFGTSVPVVNNDGTISQAIIGKEMDIVADEIFTEINTNNVANYYSLTVLNPFFPIPGFSRNMTRKQEGYVMHTITKLVQNYGVLEQVKSTYNGTENIQKTVAYDAETGSVLVNSGDNLYDRDVFSVSYPAYWQDKGLAPAYRTYFNHTVANIQAGGVVDLSGILDADEYFTEGDELVYHPAAVFPIIYKKMWILKIDGGTNEMVCIDENGDLIAAENNVLISVLRSGHRNKQGASMMSFVDLDDPTASGTLQHSKVLGASTTEFSENWTMRNGNPISCNGILEPCNPEIGEFINPYLKGVLGKWRYSKSYSYQTDRAESDWFTPVNLEESGTYQSYVPFYKYVGTDWVPITDPLHPNHSPGDTENWVLNSEITRYNENGVPIESRDVLNRYSGIIYGYNNISKTVPVASANNAEQRDILFDGFEDYDYVNDWRKCTEEGHFDYANAISPGQITEDEAHTGRNCLKLTSGQNVNTKRYTKPATESCSPQNLDLGFVLRECDSEKLFSPTPGTYILGVWVKEENMEGSTQYTAPKVEVTITDISQNTLPPTFISVQDDMIIDGWQRIEAEVVIPSDAWCIEIRLNNSGTNTVYFDDLRMHPFNSSMQTSVYDPLSLRNWSSLDGYNFATFYEYNEQGLPIRIKVETERGIRTVTENRGSIIKQP